MMRTLALIPNLFILISIVAYVALAALASHKLIKSKLTDPAKVYWCVAMIALNLPAVILFILYHDYLLSLEKRSGR